MSTAEERKLKKQSEVAKRKKSTKKLLTEKYFIQNKRLRESGRERETESFARRIMNEVGGCSALLSVVIKSRVGN